MTKPLLVNMLGEFTLQDEGSIKVVRASLAGRPRRLWILIAYLLVNRERCIAPQELIDVLWPDDRGRNPLATLQNNVSRARALLQKMGLKNGRDLILFEDGAYKWNLRHTTLVDVDTFESYAKRFESEVLPEDIDSALEACRMYKGDFLAQAESESWCISLRTNYQTLYVRLVSLTVQALLDESRLQEAKELCLQALKIDPRAEDLNILFMRTLVFDDNPKLALEHYERLKRTYAMNEGTCLSAEIEQERAGAIEALYGRDMSEASIRAFLYDDTHHQGAFFCNNIMFKEIVQLQIRGMKRQKSEAQLVSISIVSEQLDLADLMSHMKKLERTLLFSLRADDPFTKMSSSQYLILLPSATHEEGEGVLRRIMDRFQDEHPHVRVEFQVFLFDLAAFYNESYNSASEDQLDPSMQ